MLALPGGAALVGARDEHGDTPLHCVPAATGAHLRSPADSAGAPAPAEAQDTLCRIAAALRRAGADARAENGTGLTPAALARDHGQASAPPAAVRAAPFDQRRLTGLARGPPARLLARGR